MEENNACAPTRIFPRIEDCCDARDRLGKEYGRGGAHVSGQSQTARGLERRAKGELAFPGKGARPQPRLDAERIAELERKIGQQTMELDFLKKALRRFREQPLPAGANGNAGSMSKSGKRPKRRQR